MKLPEWDLPETIVDKCIEEHERILTGYKGNTETNKQKFRETLKPKHVAISLTGEPLLYAYMDELIRTFHGRGFTTFLVTNGTLPSALSKLKNEPTQLYVSVCAPEEKTYNRVCRPQIADGWKRLNETLELLPSFQCPTVMRMTLARNVNMDDVNSYAELVKKASPTYVEPKAYMHVGFSRLRLGFDNMPSHEDILDFAMELSAETGYRIVDEAAESRVVLLSSLEKVRRFDNL